MTNDTLTARFAQLKAARPELAARVDRAADLLARHLSDRAGRWIVAHVDARGEVSYEFRGSNGKTWHATHNRCDCPDATDPRRPGTCKHMLAARALEALVDHKHGEPVQVTGSAAAQAQADERARRDAVSAQLEAANRAQRRARRTWQEEV